MISAFFSLPIAVAAYYANGTATTSFQASPEIAASPSSSEELTTYVTIEMGKTITVTTPKASVTPFAAKATPTSYASEDLTTYVTVEMGKTITITTPKAQITSAPSQVPINVQPNSDDLTTYVTVMMGKTMTITTAKAQATGFNLVNGADSLGNGAKLAALAGAGVALLL